MIKNIETVEQLINLFPSNVSAIENMADQAIHQAKQDIEKIYSVEDANRTFDNTARALDRASARFSIALVIARTLELINPDELIRTAAHTAAVRLNAFNIDTFLHNERIYSILKNYIYQVTGEKLTPEQNYYLKETLEYYKKSGLDLPADKQEKVKDIKKKLGVAELNFEAHIASDDRSIEVHKNQLAGLSDEFISTLKRTPDDAYKLGVDYPTYYYVMEYCSNNSTRQALWKEFVNRAYPVNKQELSTVIALRDELAHLLGFESYAQLNIAGEMACTPGVVEGFLFNLLERSKTKVDQEFSILKASLPQSVTLSPFEKFYPWDIAFCKAAYKKKAFNLDEEDIAQYFPFNHVLEQLFDIYQEFFSLTFKKVQNALLWHPDVLTFSVHNQEHEFIGFLLLDLFPRAHKFSHAAQETIVPTIHYNNKKSPGVVLVLANFPAATADMPSLLKRTDVITFFHEFGHAIHALLGATELATLSGTNVKRDFVEMPSQMLEEWMWQPEILKRVSKHYKTGQQLPDSIINNIIKLKHFDAGDWVTRQCYLSLLSLECYSPGAHKNLDALQKDLSRSIREHIEYSHDDHFYASFAHLMDYGAQYYSYLWSKVFALDLFSVIKGAGLNNKAVGARYTTEILSKGGSADPAELIKNFLGREPTADAFLSDIGL